MFPCDISSPKSRNAYPITPGPISAPAFRHSASKTRVNALMAHAGYASLRPLLCSRPRAVAISCSPSTPIPSCSSAPRGQLPYIVDDGETIGDSDTIIAYLIAKYRLTIDAKLTGAERDTDHLITR